MKCILIEAKSLPEAWEKVMTETWENGSSFPTEYDKSADLPSKDCYATVRITSPMSEPRIHKALPLGINDLEKYRSEMIFGCHDYYMDDEENPNRWKYTYYSRLREYKSPEGVSIDQIGECVKMLKKCGYTRRARAITWRPSDDLYSEEPPCLQSISLRIENGKLNMYIFFRSNDLYKAFYSNAFVFTELQALLAQELGIPVGDYIHTSESMHLYGSYFKEITGFFNYIKNTDFQSRAWNILDCTDFLIDGCNELLSEEKMPQNKKQLIIQRKEYLTKVKNTL